MSVHWPDRSLACSGVGAGGLGYVCTSPGVVRLRVGSEWPQKASLSIALSIEFSHDRARVHRWLRGCVVLQLRCAPSPGPSLSSHPQSSKTLIPRETTDSEAGESWEGGVPEAEARARNLGGHSVGTEPTSQSRFIRRSPDRRRGFDVRVRVLLFQSGTKQEDGTSNTDQVGDPKILRSAVGVAVRIGRYGSSYSGQHCSSFSSFFPSVIWEEGRRKIFILLGLLKKSVWPHYLFVV